MADIAPSTYNPRQVKPERLELVRLSLAKLGWLLPIYADADGEERVALIGVQGGRIVAAAGYDRLREPGAAEVAFAVADDSWHSADMVPPEVTTRDSILLTYFVDQGALKFFRNRFKRVGNFVLNEVRSRTR